MNMNLFADISFWRKIVLLQYKKVLVLKIKAQHCKRFMRCNLLRNFIYIVNIALLATYI